ncbi:MAG: PaaI family thioesterase [Litoreibacter sp.]
MSDQIVSKETLLSMSGLEFMQRILIGDVPHPPIGGVMNFHVDSVDKGHVTFVGAPQAAHSNPMGTVHGGWYGAILDSALGCSVMTMVPQGSVYTTLEYKVNIARSIPLDMPVIASATVEHAGRSTGVASATLKGVEDGRLYATASTTCIIMAMS